MFKKKKKKFAKGLDSMVLTGSCGPTPVLTVHGINKKSGSLGLKNRFSRSDLLVRSGSENHDVEWGTNGFDLHVHIIRCYEHYVLLMMA